MIGMPGSFYPEFQPFVIARDVDVLVGIYAAYSTTVDRLAYSPEFDEIHAKLLTHTGRAYTRHAVYWKLFQLRKDKNAGKEVHAVVNKGRGNRSKPSPDDVQDEHVPALAKAYNALTEATIDRMAYTPEFDVLYANFLAAAGRSYTRSAVWLKLLNLRRLGEKGPLCCKKKKRKPKSGEKDLPNWA